MVSLQVIAEIRWYGERGAWRSQTVALPPSKSMLPALLQVATMHDGRTGKPNPGRATADSGPCYSNKHWVNVCVDFNAEKRQLGRAKQVQTQPYVVYDSFFCRRGWCIHLGTIMSYRPRSWQSVCWWLGMNFYYWNDM